MPDHDEWPPGWGDVDTPLESDVTGKPEVEVEDPGGGGFEEWDEAA